MAVFARVVLPLALSLTALAILGPARTAALDPAQAATVAAPAPAAKDTRDEGDGNWLDVGHAFIEHRIFAPALRVDRFFSDERDLEPERARSFIQWRQELRFARYRSTPSYTTTLGANLKFPGLNKELRKLQVEIAGQTRDAFNALFPSERPSSGEAAAEQTFGTADAGVGYRLFETVASTIATHGDLGAGVILDLPPGAYGRARLRFAESLGGRILARQALTGFWRTDTLFGTTVSAELERPLAASTLARLSGSTTLTQRSRGWEWGGDLSLIGTLRARIGAQLGLGVSGATQGPVGVDVYRLFLRLRRDFYRKWIFVELQPEQAWPWDLEHGRRPIWTVALRLEIQFRGNESPRVRAPDEPADDEPKDPESRAPGSPTALPAPPAPG